MNVELTGHRSKEKMRLMLSKFPDGFAGFKENQIRQSEVRNVS